MTTTTATAARLGAALGLALTLAPGVPAHADPSTCQGRAVTVTGDAGTDGDDVMVVGPGQRSISTGAGADLVCIRLLDDTRRSLYLDTGAGDDVVHNETTASERVAYVTLGTGADTYVGSDATTDYVYAGADSWGGTSDTEKDVVDTRGGNDAVTSGSVSPGTPNADDIATGDGDDSVRWSGEQAGGRLDLGGGENRLVLNSGWAGSDVDVDAPEGLVTVDERPVLRWTGDVADYTLQYTHLRTTFTGTDLDEYVTFWPSQRDQTGPPSVVGDPGLRLDADLGGGDDRLELLDAASGTWVGGAGRDRLGMPRCQVADVHLGREFECTDEARARTAYSGALDVWEKASVPGGHVKVVGTNGPDTIRVFGRTAYVDGRGGRDVLSSSSDRTAKASRVPIVLKGGSGADRLRGGYSNERLVGGPGDDSLVGGPGEDRISGGPGRDRAVGGPGRDACTAEVRRSCERR